MTAATVEKPLSLNSLSRILDPRKQLMRTAATITLAEQEATTRALRRNAAAWLLFRAKEDAGEAIQPAEVWRDLIEVSRSLWHKIRDEANPERITEVGAELAEVQTVIAQAEAAGELVDIRTRREEAKLAHKLQRHIAQVQAVDELRDELDSGVVDLGDLRSIARQEAEAVRDLETLIDGAMKLRDRVAIELMDGTHGGPVPNAEIARITGLSTARVAQLRQLR